MCVERTHRFLMASVLALGAFLTTQGNPVGQYIVWFVIGMLVLFGVTNFCPSVWMMHKAGMKSCSSKQDPAKED